MLYACAKLSQGSRVLVLIFVNKIFVIGKPLTKITKIFLLENFQLYGIPNMPAAYLGIVVWGEGLSNREFPTSGTTLHILKCGICLSYYRVFVLVISILCILIE